jgi:tRNA-splicing ligase RtcB (3'-phosphate/5'-hydroxy nucleic acid ligase)
MIRTISTEKIPIKLWLEDIEPGALQQAKDIANLPHAARHVAIMPDCHQGFGMPIGGVLATRGVVIPNAVGVDIGCGMCVHRTSLTQISRRDLVRVVEDIKKSIPVGFRHHKQPRPAGLLPAVDSSLPVAERELGNAAFQLGTLGGGNHFIELQKGSDGYIWIMVHSGSRNLGKQVADHYYKKASLLNKTAYSGLKIPVQLAHLPLDSDEGQLYLREMEFCVKFAFASRKLMMDTVSGIIGDHFAGVSFSGFINIAHNYASREVHFGEQLIVHRKGATSARKGELCIIPGSQGSNSFIAKGKGNPESFESCSHGAGRVMGRKEAQRTLNLLEEKGKLDKKGIIHSVLSKKDLDEASGAYKNINLVMKLQEDLVEITTELHPLAVVKG